MINESNFILYAQHGWADNSKEISKLAQALSTENNLVITPDLGWVKTWINIKILIKKLETIVINKRKEYPHLPMRIIGHSMGGLIWLELLNNHPEWHSNIHSLILIASPVNGADLARIIDPLSVGIGIAKDLGKSRRLIAESIAQVIPTLIIAGDVDNGSDGTITVQTTKFNYAKFVCLKGLYHSQLKSSFQLIEIINNFWQNPVITPLFPPDFGSLLIEKLRKIPGITDAHPRDFKHSKTYFTFQNGFTIKTWQNLTGITHVFLADNQDKCIYGGFVGWIHTKNLYHSLEEIKNN